MLLLMPFAITRRSQVVDRLERFVEAALFLIAAVEGNGLDGVVGFEKTFCRPFEPLTDDVGVDGRLDEFMEAKLELLAIDGELLANSLNVVFFVKMLVDVRSDF